MSLGLALGPASVLPVAGAFGWTKNTTGRPLPPTVERSVAFAGTLLAAEALLLHPGAIGYVVAILGLVVGAKAPEFGSRDAEGREFRLSGVSGSRALLKLFRGPGVLIASPMRQDGQGSLGRDAMGRGAMKEEGN